MSLQPGEEPPDLDLDSEVLDFMPRPGSQGLDLDFTFWPMPPADLGEFSKDDVLSNWFWDVKPLGGGMKAVQLTVVRLLPWGGPA